MTNDAFAPLRAAAARRKATAPAGLLRARPDASLPTPRRAGAGRFRRRLRGAPPLQGRWSLTAPVFGAADVAGDAHARAWAELLLERYGVLTRELVRAEGHPGGFAALYPALSALETVGAARRGYFVEGLGGAQFALPGAVDRLRALEDAETAPLVLATADPAQLYGAGLRWPGEPAKAPARRGGTQLVVYAGRPALSVEAGGKRLRLLEAATADPAVLDRSLAALAAAVRSGRAPRLAIERIGDWPATASPLAARLPALGFRLVVDRFTLDAGP